MREAFEKQEERLISSSDGGGGGVLVLRMVAERGDGREGFGAKQMSGDE